MIPVAPTLGATLYADATTLRPLAAGMRWTYAGTRTTTANVGRYDSDVRIESEGGALVEKGWQVFEGGHESSTLTVSSGNVSSSEMLDLGGAQAQAVTSIELRSPVRANDQIVVLERFDVATTSDIDGDKKTDTVDLAFYRRVIGDEDVDLPALGRTMRALRVDDTAIIRFHRSSDGGLAPAVTTTGSTWYAPGVGIVRRSLSEPLAGGESQQYDERLQAFDGGIQGRGALMHTRPDQPALQGLLGQTLLGATALGNKVLVLSRHIPAGAAVPVARLAVLDASGRVLSSRVVEGMSADEFAPSQLVGGATEALLVARETVSRDDPFIHYQLRAWRVDADGQLVGPASGTVLPLGEMHYAGSYRIAAEGGRWWVLWQGGTADGQSTPMPLYLQAFDTAWQPASTRHALEPGKLFVMPRIFGLATAPGRVGAVWTAADPWTELRVAQLTSDGTPRITSLGQVDDTSAQLGWGNTAPLTLMGDGRAALYWHSTLFGAWDARSLRMRGLLVGADGNPVRTTAGSLETEWLPAQWGVASSTPVSVGGPGGLLLGSWGYESWRPGDPPTTAILQLAKVSVGANAGLAAGTANVLRWRAYDTLHGPFDHYGRFSPSVWVRLNDRVMVLGDDLRTVGLAFLD